MNHCFICLQSENNPISLLTTDKQCICDGYVHIECITNWYHHSSSCPICRKSNKPTHFSLVEFYCNQRDDIKTNIIIYIIFIATVIIIILLPSI